MQFALICRDGPDALDRRLAVRDAHLAGVHALKRDGRILDGGALLDDAGRMIGSVVLCDFADRAALDAWLATEPFVLAQVWQDIEIVPFRQVNWAAG